jgi:dienelactone hydrolase
MPVELVLFHSVLGLRTAVHDFADALRAAGHTVHTPDLFEGRTFDEIDAGMAFKDDLTEDVAMARAEAALAPLPEALVYAGFSFGGGLAQHFAQTRPGAVGAVLMHEAYDGEGAEIPMTIHSMVDDPWFDVEAAKRMPNSELFLYPGSGHLFLDDGHPDYDADAAALVRERVLAFLDRL